MSQGGVIILHDLRTHASVEAYRELPAGMSFCLNITRSIISLKWINDTQLVYETINGLFLLNLNTKRVSQLYKFKPETGYYRSKYIRPVMQDVRLPFILFNDNRLLNIDTGKWLKADSELGSVDIHLIHNIADTRSMNAI